VTQDPPNEDGANGTRTRDLHAASVALSQLSYGPARTRVAKRLRHRFAGEAEGVDAHTIPAAAAGLLFMLAGALIVAVLLVYFALGVADAD
jgi:chromate transport protein ChrA